MQEKRFDVSYPAYQADALIRVLRSQQRDISEELKPALDELYRKMVPAEEQAKIETLIAKERAETDTPKMGVIWLHDRDEDLYLTSTGCIDFCKAAEVYYDCLREDVTDIGMLYSLDCYQNSFADQQIIDEMTYDIFCTAALHDSRVWAVLEFDIEAMALAVSRGTEPRRSYRLQDIETAMESVTETDGTRLYDWEARFEVYLHGMELEHAEPDREDNLTM